MHRLWRWQLIVLCMLPLLGNADSPSIADIRLTPPESVGFSSAALKAYEQALRALVDERRLAGFTTLVARHGKVVAFDAYGYRDVSAKVPMTGNTIFRIASMTKPITGVAMMLLWEQGKWKLDDPVHKHIPEFAGLNVKNETGLVQQSEPMTMRQLMSHTAGFDGNAGYVSANLRETDLQGMIDKLAALPLASQPGTDWRYGPSVDIQGYIIEKLSGLKLDRFLSTHIFEPLKMKDTGFWLEKSEVNRLTRIHANGPDKKVILANVAGDPSSKPRFLSGSGGLLSTTEDYWRFAQMLLNKGELDGVRILKPATVELMRTNALREGVHLDEYGTNELGIGFGLGFALVLDPAKANTPLGRNTFYWDGAFGTWFWIDPTNDVIVIGMIQSADGSRPDGDTPQLRTTSPKMIYAALVR